MDSAIVVQVSMMTLLASVLGGVAALIAGLWVVASFAISGLRDDVSSIRQSLIQTNSTMQSVERDGQSQILEMNKEILELNKELTKTYGDLKIELVKLGVQSELTNRSVDSLTSGLAATNKSIESLSSRLETTSKSVESLAVGLSRTNKSMDDLSSRLAKFQAVPALPQAR